MNKTPHTLSTDREAIPALPTLPRITLVSASPRRQELLRTVGIAFIVRPADAPEETVTTATVERSRDPHETCRRVTLERARLKAAMVSPDPSAPIALAADTTVDAGGVLLDKPENEQHARFMLQQLSGTTHQVHSAVILYDDFSSPAHWIEEVVTTHVTFAPLSEQDLAWYFSPMLSDADEDGSAVQEEWHGVAGGYRIQGRAAAFTQELKGSYHAVMGLPIHTVYSMIARFHARRSG